MPDNITRAYYLWRKAIEPSFSQAKLAREIGVSKRTAERWIAGLVTVPRYRLEPVERRILATEEFFQTKMPRQVDNVSASGVN